MLEIIDGGDDHDLFDLNWADDWVYDRRMILMNVPFMMMDDYKYGNRRIPPHALAVSADVPRREVEYAYWPHVNPTFDNSV